MFIDFSKAYNSLDHEELCNLVRNERLDEMTQQYIIKSIKSQSVWIANTFYKVKRGVPQGSALSPWLFNVFMEDVIRKTEKEFGVSIISYADDLVVTGKFNFKRLEESLESYGLKVNRKKCGTFWKQLDEDIPMVKEYKYLGVTINS